MNVGEHTATADVGLPCTGPVQPSVLSRGLLYVQSRGDESADSYGLPLFEGGLTANVCVLLSCFTIMAEPRALVDPQSSRPLLEDGTAHRQDRPSWHRRTALSWGNQHEDTSVHFTQKSSAIWRLDGPCRLLMGMGHRR